MGKYQIKLSAIKDAMRPVDSFPFAIKETDWFQSRDKWMYPLLRVPWDEMSPGKYVYFFVFGRRCECLIMTKESLTHHITELPKKDETKWGEPMPESACRFIVDALTGKINGTVYG